LGGDGGGGGGLGDAGGRSASECSVHRPTVLVKGNLSHKRRKLLH
jgi:hypothetical protein